MRVLGVFSTNELLGGGEISFTLSLRSLHESGCSVLAVVTGEGELADYLKGAGLSCAVAPQPPLGRNLQLRRLFQADPRLLSIAKEFRPDLIHCNAIRPALYGQAVARRLGVPIVMHARKTEKDPLIDHFLLARLNAIICTSEAVRRRFPRWPRRARLPVLYNPVDISAYETPPPASSQLREQWGGANNLLVGVIGRLSTIKGQQLIVEAAPKILAAAPQTRFVFLGVEDPSFPGFKAELDRRIATLGLGDRFVFAPPITNPAAAYHALDIIAFPTNSEGFGRVIIEAGAARKPLVTSDIPVVREVLGPDLEDLTTPCGLAEPLGERLIQLLADRRLMESVADRLNRRVRLNFGIDVHRAGLCRIYDEVRVA